MPKLRLPILDTPSATATLVKWCKQQGDSFGHQELLAEFETEDATVLVVAGVAGTLVEMLLTPGQTIAVGSAMAQVELVDIEAAAAGRATPKESAVQGPTFESSAENVVPILMPQAGNTMEEGTVVSWMVKEGDEIEMGQVICEIETDKATMEFESPASGRLARIVAEVGEPVPVKSLIALLADRDADASSYLAAQRGATGGSEQLAGSRETSTAAVSVSDSDGFGGEATVPRLDSPGGRIKASPAARRAATNRGIALESVGTGSGPAGRVLSTDVIGGSAAPIPVPPVDDVSAAAQRKPMSKMRRAIASNLQRSKQTIPHFYVRLTIDAGPLSDFYSEQQAATRCTLNDLVVLAVGRAMRDFPAVRSQLVDGEILEHPHANIGIAVGVDDGLVVPVVLNVDQLSLGQLAAESKRVVENGRKGVLENAGKGNFTISNLGMFGVEEFSAIINPPEAAILAVSAIREDVIVENGAMRPGRVMTMTLSADHRIVDGLLAAKFVARLREILEHPDQELS